MNFGAILFAGGEGTRMGGPKALLAKDGESIAFMHAARFLHAGAALVVIAVPPEAAAILSRALQSVAAAAQSRELPTSFAYRVYIASVTTHEPKDTIMQGFDAATLQGAFAVPHGTTTHAGQAERGDERALDAFFVHPVDGGVAAPATLHALLARLADEHVDAASPSYDERGGHPVLIRARLFARLAPMPHLRALLHDPSVRREFVAVDDPSILVDVDTPEDFARVYGCAPQFLAEP